MEAKELMIGDIVRLVYRVGTFVSKVNLENLIDNREGKMEYEPIPLTPEILEKNGWDMYGCPDHKCWGHYLDASEYGSQYVPFSICLFDFMNKGSMYGDDFYEQIIIHVRFVHELQRALRCCGLWDLADNFVV